MFYVMRKTKAHNWAKTMFGWRSIVCQQPENSKEFPGIPLKVEADHALEQARKEHPNETYKLIYSEEEL